MSLLCRSYIIFQNTMLFRGRNPTRRRTEPDQAANGVRTDGGREPIRRRTESDQTAEGL